MWFLLHSVLESFHIKWCDYKFLLSLFSSIDYLFCLWGLIHCILQALELLSFLNNPRIYRGKGFSFSLAKKEETKAKIHRDNKFIIIFSVCFHSSFIFIEIKSIKGRSSHLFWFLLLYSNLPFRLIMTYGIDFSPIKDNTRKKLNVVEMRILIKIDISNDRKDGIKNERIWAHLGLISICDKLKYIHLWWFEHVQCSQ